MKPVFPTTPPLTADQLRIATLYASMTARSQREVMEYMTVVAAAFPLRAAPTLRVVKGGAA